MITITRLILRIQAELLLNSQFSLSHHHSWLSEPFAGQVVQRQDNQPLGSQQTVTGHQATSSVTEAQFMANSPGSCPTLHHVQSFSSNMRANSCDFITVKSTGFIQTFWIHCHYFCLFNLFFYLTSQAPAHIDSCSLVHLQLILCGRTWLN